MTQVNCEGRVVALGGNRARAVAERCCAVVVSYNRRQSLLRTLAAIEAMRPAPAAVIVVDNGSTDASFDAVRRRFPRFGVLRIDCNRGAATGFHWGMREAMRSGVQWLWTLDDDVAPSPDALAQLAPYTERFRCLHPSRADVAGRRLPWSGHIDLRSGRRHCSSERAFARGAAFDRVNFACFEGMLVHRELVERVGLPDCRFFISGYDTVFGLLASRLGDVGYLPALSIHKTLEEGKLHRMFGRYSRREGALKQYAHVRDAYLLLRFIADEGQLSPLARWRLLATHLKVWLGTLLYERDLRKLRLIARGIAEGWRGDFSPLDADGRVAERPATGRYYPPATGAHRPTVARQRAVAAVDG